MVGVWMNTVLFLPVIMVTYAAILGSLCESEQHISLITKVSTNKNKLLEFINIHVFFIIINIILSVMEFYISLNILNIPLDFKFFMIIKDLDIDIPCINWQFKAFSCISFVVSGFKVKKIYPKRNIELDFKKIKGFEFN